MGTTRSSSDRRGAVERLAEGEVVRLPDAVDTSLCKAVAESETAWTPAGAFVTAPLADAPLTAAIEAVLAEAGLALAAAPTLLQHRPGDHGLPKAEGRAFLLDLADGRSQDGGLLLIENTPVHGWRPQAGAMTLFDAGKPPLLSLVAPTARTPRLSVFGRLA